MASVILEGVTKEYPGPVTAVQDLDLVINDHELVVIVGPSGCGKTTTLRLIAGLERVTSGRILIGNCPVNRTSPKDRNIAMVFQNFALYPHLSVYKNMAFGLHLRYGGGLLNRILRQLIRPARAAELAVLRRGIKQQVQQAASMLGIEHLLSRLPRHLSGGERQRVALGRAIVRKPAAFLFDEPFSNLDAKLRMEMRAELKELHDQLATTIVYVTHDQAEAMTLGQRIIVMANGRIQQIGPPMEIYSRPRNRFVAEFIGTPSMNLATGDLRTDQDGWKFEGEGLSINLRKVQETLTKGLGQFAKQRITV
ncbi:MAG: ABC transporter ATP-binding protein, partial [Planctomycetes bacterium]|nr:ABC transporter ATP-binding protein [Planctomycetota bacterium]